MYGLESRPGITWDYMKPASHQWAAVGTRVLGPDLVGLGLESQTVDSNSNSSRDLQDSDLRDSDGLGNICIWRVD